MNDAEKLIWMFTEVHGEFGGSFSLEVGEDEYGEYDRIRVIKDGNLCLERTKCDLVFEFLTKHL